MNKIARPGLPSRTLVFILTLALACAALPAWAVAIPSDGFVDPLFKAAMGTGPQAIVNVVEVQPDDKVVVGGSFTSFDGTPSGSITRLNSDGSIDAAFAANVGEGFNGRVLSLALQADGAIVVGGSFTSYRGTAVGHLARLNSDGTLDTAFAASIGTGFSAEVHRVAVQPNGMILAASEANATFNGAAAWTLVRLNPNGTMDPDFGVLPATRIKGLIYSLAVQSDGKIVVGGTSLSIGGTTVPILLRLNADGTQDVAFSSAVGPISGVVVYDVMIQSNGGILFGGTLTSVGGAPVPNMARLTPAGSVDSAFLTNFGTGNVSGPYSFVEQTDGSVVVGGYPGTSPGLTRFSATGVVDTAFATNLGTGSAPSRVNSMGVQSDGKIIIAYGGTSFNGFSSPYLVRTGLPTVPASSTVEASPESITADGVSTSTITVTSRDAFGTPTGVSGGPVVLATTAGTLTAVTDHGDGTYTATLTSTTTVETATISFTMAGAEGGSTATVDFVAGPAEPNLSSIAASPVRIVADGSSTSTVTVRLKDALGHLVSGAGDIVAMSTTAGTLGAVTNNGDGTYTATLTSSTDLVDAIISFTVDGADAASTATVSFVPGVADATASTISVNPAVLIADGKSTATVTVTVKDAQGHVVAAAGHLVGMSTTDGTLGAVTNNGDGTYTATLTSSTDIVNATVGFTLDGATGGSTVIVPFIAGPPDMMESTVVADPTTIAADGVSTSTVTVTVKGKAGQIVSAAGSVVTMSTTAGTLSAVTDNGDGTYTATLTSAFNPGEAIVSFEVNGEAGAATAKVMFVAGAPSGKSSTISATPTTIIADGVSKATVKVTLRDDQGRLLAKSGSVVTMSTTAGTLSAVTDNGDGTYTATLTSSTTAETATISFTVGGEAGQSTATVIFKARGSALPITGPSADMALVGLAALVLGGLGGIALRQRRRMGDN